MIAVAVYSITSSGSRSVITSPDDFSPLPEFAVSTPSSERITACMHSNCKDIWVLEHGTGNNNFKAWLVTSSGVSAAPVVSAVGTIPSVPYGFMRLSHNGKKLIMSAYNGTGKNLFLYDFNNTTGVVSGEIDVTASPATARQNPYGGCPVKARPS